jgi:glycosyltransferase involved in cell wall biosynthesis
VRRELGWRDDQFVVLHAGNMGLKQGLEVVVQAAREARHVQPKLRFELLGDGSQRSALIAEARDLDNLHFRDPVGDDEFPEVLAAADLLLVTQRSSVLDMSLPSKLTSYFAAGRPVLASVAEGGTADEVHRAAGRVIQAEDPTALWTAAFELAANPEEADRIGAAGRRYADAELSMSAGLSRMYRLLADALDSPAS